MESFLVINQPEQEKYPRLCNLEYFNNPDKAYRVIVGEEAFKDIVDTGVVRTNALTKPVETLKQKILHRPTRFPSFSGGEVSVSYANENPNHYIIITNIESVSLSSSGRHGKGTTMFPSGEDGRPLESLSGDNVQVYKHTGNENYKLVYADGKTVT